MSQATMQQQQNYIAVAQENIAEDAEATRDLALLAVSIEKIQHLDSRELATIQGILGHGDVLGTWITTPDWLPPGHPRIFLSLNLRQRIWNFLPENLKLASVDIDQSNAATKMSLTAIIDLAVLSFSRYLIILRIGPSGMGCYGNHRPLKPSTIVQIAYSYVSKLFALAVAKQVGQAIPAHIPSDSERDDRQTEISLLSGVTLDDMSIFNRQTRADILLECKRIKMLVARELWWDDTSTNAPSLAKAMKGSELHNEQPNEIKSHLPLPDDYVAQIGPRSFWLMQNLAPNIFTIANTIAELRIEAGETGFTQETIAARRKNKIRTIIADHNWLDGEGRPFEVPPFPLLPKQGGISTDTRDKANEIRWPPSSERDIMGLLGVIQMAHYFIVALSTGARKSEALGLQRNCIFKAADGRLYANGWTYKLVQRHGGEERDWLLPEIAVTAIEQQVRLISLVERIIYTDSTPPPSRSDPPPVASSSTRNHLWAQISSGPGSDRKLPLKNINVALVNYARTLGMDTAPGGQRLRSHRFRKTLARLVALSLTQAPMLLMEIFGHKSIEMTLKYILTDKDLCAEIETISRELRVMRAKEVVERMVEADMTTKTTGSSSLGGYGGLGAISVHNAVGTHQKQVHRRGEQWGAKNVMELAELLTLQGKAWEQVRHGVLCTKLPGEAGPCNKSKGRPEPSKCQSRCTHRLEDAFMREDVDEAIREALVAYELAMADDESLTAAHWAAQVRAHVPRFPDLYAKWILNPTVRGLVDI